MLEAGSISPSTQSGSTLLFSSVQGIYLPAVKQIIFMMQSNRHTDTL